MYISILHDIMSFMLCIYVFSLKQDIVKMEKSINGLNDCYVCTLPRGHQSIVTLTAISLWNNKILNFNQLEHGNEQIE